MKTITVRAAVAVDLDTIGLDKVEWVVLGEDDTVDESLITRARNRIYDSGNIQTTLITVEIPIREPAEVQAEVEESIFTREDVEKARAIGNNWTIDFNEVQPWAMSLADRIEARLPPEKNERTLAQEKVEK